MAVDHDCVIDLTDFLKTLVWLNTIFALRLIILMEIVSIKGSCLIDLAMKLSDERPTKNKQACEEGATILAVPALCRL